jgi:hypothetical protein
MKRVGTLKDCMYVHTCVCMYVCILCMCVCMYVCMCIYVCIYVYVCILHTTACVAVPKLVISIQAILRPVEKDMLAC